MEYRTPACAAKFTIICGCFSRNRNKNVKNSDFYKIPLNKVYSSIDELIKREKENIELAVVLTPPHNRNKIYYTGCYRMRCIFWNIIVFFNI